MIPQHVGDDGDYITRLNDGRLVRGATMILDPEDIIRIKQGYVCIHCQEPHERPFPEKCLVCGFPMRALQRKHFDMQYAGSDPEEPLERKLDRLDAEDEEKVFVPKPQILIPKSL